jgi:excisionase family DNA binding protein
MKTKPKGAVMLRPAGEMSLAEAARLLDCSYWTVRNMIADGRLRGGTRGRNGHERRYVDPKSVGAFLKP